MKPYRWIKNVGMWRNWCVVDANDNTVAVVPAFWGHLGEGVAEGIARSLNMTDRVLLPTATNEMREDYVHVNDVIA